MCELVQNSIAYLLVLVSNIAGMLFLCDKLLKRRHSYTVCIIYISSKSLILNVGFKIFLAEQIATNEVINSIYLVLVSVAAVLTYIVFLYTYDEDFVKIAIVCSFSEMLTMIIGDAVIIVINFISGDPLMEFAGKFHAIDLLLPILTWTCIAGIIKLGRPIWKKVREWKVKRRKLIMGIFLLYMILGIVTMYLQFDQYVIVLGTFWALVWSGILVGYVNFFHWKTMRENEVLRKRHAVARMQYESVALEIKKMEQMQREIQIQMQTVWKLSKTTENKTEQLEKYIMELKLHSEHLVSGVYCDDWFLDSILHDAMKKCEGKGIQADFYLQGYRKDQEQGEELANYVRQLLDKAMEKTKHTLSLRMTTVKGQVVIKLSVDEKEKTLLYMQK